MSSEHRDASRGDRDDHGEHSEHGEQEHGEQEHGGQGGHERRRGERAPGGVRVAGGFAVSVAACAVVAPVVADVQVRCWLMALVVALSGLVARDVLAASATAVTAWCLTTGFLVNTLGTLTFGHDDLLRLALMAAAALGGTALGHATHAALNHARHTPSTGRAASTQVVASGEHASSTQPAASTEHTRFAGRAASAQGVTTGEHASSAPPATSTEHTSFPRRAASAEWATSGGRDGVGGDGGVGPYQGAERVAGA